MNTIKFSHSYPKIWGQTQGKLIYVGRLDGRTLPAELIDYDTTYYETKMDGKFSISDAKFYPLPKTELIQLVFLGSKGIPFCTLRRFTEQKFKYYSSKIQEVFDIVVE